MEMSEFKVKKSRLGGPVPGGRIYAVMLGSRASLLQRGWRSHRLAIGPRCYPSRIAVGVRWSSGGNILPHSEDLHSTPELQKIPESLNETAAPFTSEAAELATQQVHDLHALGLGNGWGPTSTLTNLIDWMHGLSGLPWWGSIMLSTLVVRMAMLPVSIKVASTMGKLAKYQPEINAEMAKMRAAQMKGDKIESGRAQMVVSQLYKTAGVRRLDPLWGLTQIPVFFCFYRAIMKMSELPVPGFTHGGALWFPDLTTPDVYFGLGAISAAISYRTFKMGSENGSTTAMSQSVLRVMSILPLVIVPISRFLPAGVVVYFVANACFSFLQGMLLRSPGARKFLRIPPLPSKEELEKSQIARAPKGFRENFNAMMKSFRDQAEVAREKAMEKQREKDYQTALKNRATLKPAKLEDMDPETRARKERQRKRVAGRSKPRSKV